MLPAFRHTRIIATLGPATSNPEAVRALLGAGVNVFRLNFSHGSHEQHQANVDLIREASVQVDRPIGILQDLQGPKIRVGTFADGQVELEHGQDFILSCVDNSPGNARRASVSHPRLCLDVVQGCRLLLDDGKLALEVTRVTEDSVHTKVLRGGTLSNNKGINIPDADLSIAALTDKDVDDLIFGTKLGVDWVAVSFVRSRDDLILARHYLARYGSQAKLMAKIEKPAAVHNFDAILAEVDGVMVARGDLGVELSYERVPTVQKRLIRAAQEAGKPVVTATQMLESMVASPQPTRAEASDVANAIHDGTDAVMLSQETAIGQYPVEAVQMMDRIARNVEADEQFQMMLRERRPNPLRTVADAVSLAACEMAHTLSAKVLVVLTLTGTTAQRVSRYRYETPVIAITPMETTYRQLSLCWGVMAIRGELVHSTDDMVKVADQWLRETGVAKPGERYVITAGAPFGVRGTTNMIRVEHVRE